MIGFHDKKFGLRCLREQGTVPDRYVRLVQDTYEDAITQVKTSV